MMSRIVFAPAFALCFVLAGGSGASALGIMFETDADAASGEELAFVTYPTLQNALDGADGDERFSAIDVAPGFGSRGVTWDGDAFVVMFETDADALSGRELAFVRYPTLQDVIDGADGDERFSAIDVAPGFGSRGLTWDGSRFLLMFETDADALSGRELAFIAYPTWQDVLDGSNGDERFSAIDVAPEFGSAGLFSAPATESAVGEVPLPATLGPLGAAALLLGALRRRRSRIAAAPSS